MSKKNPVAPQDSSPLTPTSTTPITEEQVAQYLTQNPDFFERHLDLLLSLKLYHPSGNAISLIEKQVHTFRERNSNIREKLNVLLSNARENDRLFELSQRLTLALIECEELGDVFDALNYSLTQEFNVHHSSIWVLDHNLNSATTHLLNNADFLPALAERLKSNKIAFSGISRTEINALFDEPNAIGSAALSIVRSGGTPIAVIAVGHEDEQRYLVNGGTLFLRHLSELLSRVLGKFVH